jgi:drug/metabolite transporter (DMT)-like permease
MRRGGFVLAFLAVYLIWGSTYLAIAVAVESIPPLAMMSVRSLAAGLILFAWSRRSAHTLDASAWRAAFIAGFLLFLLSHGSLAWAEQRVPSAVAALLGATSPLWLALIDWRWGSGRVVGWYGRAGLAVGFAGVALLVAPEWGKSDTGATVANLAVVGAALAWAAGSVYGRGAPLPRDVRLSTAVQLIAGSAWLAAGSIGMGEWRAFSPGRVTMDSVAALLYLIVFGSVVAFTAYVWLLRVTTASMVGTHAYVNPIVAVALGAALAGERITVMTIVSAITIVGGVILVLIDKTRPRDTHAVEASASASPASQLLTDRSC